jgi:tetratricopeptide (TPR) repeat protein
LFFYVAILPASRIIGEGAALSQLMDRMLYLPSVGLAIAFAALLSLVASRFRPRVAFFATVVVTLIFVPVTWARNHQWGDEIRLLEHDFSVMQQNGQLMFALVRAHANRDNELRALELCEHHADLANRLPPVANECAQAAQQLRRFDQAEAYFLQSLGRKDSDARTHFLLARLYIDMDRRRDAQTHYRQAIDRERIPYLREFFSGMMLVDLYPYHPERLDEARRHLQNALLLQPRFIQARDVLEQLESRPGAKPQ